MQIFLTIVLPFSLLLIGLWLLKLARIKTNDNCELLSISYILSLAIVFTVLYLGSIFGVFGIASLIVLVLVLISIIHLSLLFTIKTLRSPQNLKTSLVQWISKERLIVISSAIGLLLIYSAYLSSRAILDSDVAQEYLPISREIVKRNGFTYTNGYDYNILLKPIGVSVLYAWTYSLTGSTFSESFRMLPLVPILMLIVLTYGITSSATKSKSLGILSSAILLVLPFNDRFLLYNAFYPDTFYYPLIFSATYFLLKFFQCKQNKLLLWTGIGLGIASLLKAQTIYTFVALILVLLVLELRRFKKLSITLSCLAPFCILIPYILASSIQSSGFHLSIPSLTETQWILLLFISMLSGLCFAATISQNATETRGDLPKIITALAKRIGSLAIPCGIFSSLWYANNLLRFGTPIWTSSINMPNYDWALGVLKPLDSFQQSADLVHYLAYFLFMFVDPAVMGYVSLAPLLIGLFFFIKSRDENLGVFLFFEILTASLILSTVVISLPSASVYNPRDILVLAPLLTTFSALGIQSITTRVSKDSDNAVSVFISFLLVSIFGLLNYIHSVLVWYVSQFHVTLTGEVASFFARIVGLNLAQTSFQLPYEKRVIFVGDNIFRVLSLSIISGVPLLILAIWPRLKLLIQKTIRLNAQHGSRRKLNSAEAFVLLALLLHVIILPRAEIFLAQGGFREIQYTQLKRSYGALFELIADRNKTLNGGILTFRSPNGLPYYLPNIKIVDLSYPANLAFLKDCLLSGSANETVVRLRQLGINYLLFNPSITKELDASLNFTISKIIQNPMLSILLQKFGSWMLYALGPYKVERISIPLSGWSVEKQLTNAPYTLVSDESYLFLELHPTDSNSRATIFYSSVPKLNLSKYDYILVQAQGTDNARILLRFFLDDKTSFDIAYWEDPYKLNSIPFGLKSYAARSLRGDVYLGLKSSDGSPSSVNITDISFIKIEG